MNDKMDYRADNFKNGLYIFLWFVFIIICFHIVMTKGEAAYASIAAFWAGIFLGKMQ